jgi:hypothetical protein
MRITTTIDAPMPTAPRMPLLVNLAWATALALLLSVGYVASYPLALRAGGHHDIVAYRPVQRLIDDGPLEDPMLWWAGLWGVDAEVIVASVMRKFEAGEVGVEGCSWSHAMRGGATDERPRTNTR